MECAGHPLHTPAHAPITWAKPRLFADVKTRGDASSRLLCLLPLSQGEVEGFQVVPAAGWGAEAGNPPSPLPWALSWLRCKAGEERGRQPCGSHPEIYAHGGYEHPGEKGPIFELEQEAGFPHA